MSSHTNNPISGHVQYTIRKAIAQILFVGTGGSEANGFLSLWLDQIPGQVWQIPRQDKKNENTNNDLK